MKSRGKPLLVDEIQRWTSLDDEIQRPTALGDETQKRLLLWQMNPISKPLFMCSILMIFRDGPLFVCFMMMKSRGRLSFKSYNKFWFWFLTEEIQYQDGLRSRKLGQAKEILLQEAQRQLLYYENQIRACSFNHQLVYMGKMIYFKIL